MELLQRTDSCRGGADSHCKFDHVPKCHTHVGELFVLGGVLIQVEDESLLRSSKSAWYEVI